MQHKGTVLLCSVLPACQKGRLEQHKKVDIFEIIEDVDFFMFKSIGQNVMLASSKYHYENGYFGVKTGHHIRNIDSDNPLAAAKDFYDKIAFGGTETVHNGGALNITRIRKGTLIIDWRQL